MDQKAELHKRVERDFTYHAPQGDQVARYNRLREKAKALAHEIIEFTPVSWEQSLALTLLEQASMMANAAIARNETASAGPDPNTLYPDVLTTQAPAAEDQAEQLNAVYAERNMCVALIYHMARKLGYNYGLRQSSDYEPGWQNCVMIDLPTGQISWHIKDSEEEWFAEGNMLRGYMGQWDQHTTEEKYQRVLAYGNFDQSQRAGGAPMRQQQPGDWEAMREEVKAMRLGDLQREMNQVTGQLPAIAPEQEI